MSFQGVWRSKKPGKFKEYLISGKLWGKSENFHKSNANDRCDSVCRCFPSGHYWSTNSRIRSGFLFILLFLYTKRSRRHSYFGLKRVAKLFSNRAKSTKRFCYPSAVRAEPPLPPLQNRIHIQWRFAYKRAPLHGATLSMRWLLPPTPAERFVQINFGQVYTCTPAPLLHHLNVAVRKDRGNADLYCSRASSADSSLSYQQIGKKCRINRSPSISGKNAYCQVAIMDLNRFKWEILWADFPLDVTKLWFPFFLVFLNGLIGFLIFSSWSVTKQNA